MHWYLTDLYQGVDDSQFKADLEDLIGMAKRVDKAHMGRLKGTPGDAFTVDAEMSCLFLHEGHGCGQREDHAETRQGQRGVASEQYPLLGSADLLVCNQVTALPVDRPAWLTARGREPS